MSCPSSFPNFRKSYPLPCSTSIEGRGRFMLWLPALNLQGCVVLPCKLFLSDTPTRNNRKVIDQGMLDITQNVILINTKQNNTSRVGQLSLRPSCLLMNGWSPIRQSAGRTGQTSLKVGGWGLRQEEIAIRKQTTVGGSSKTLFACFVTTDTVYSILLVDLQHVMFEAYFKVRN